MENFPYTIAAFVVIAFGMYWRSKCWSELPKIKIIDDQFINVEYFFTSSYATTSAKAVSSLN